LSWNHSIRHFHRWTSIVFTITVIANIAFLSAGTGQPPAYVTYSPLLPLALLLISGLYLFVLPYAKQGGARLTAGEA